VSSRPSNARLLKDTSPRDTTSTATPATSTATTTTTPTTHQRQGIGPSSGPAPTNLTCNNSSAPSGEPHHPNLSLSNSSSGPTETRPRRKSPRDGHSSSSRRGKNKATRERPASSTSNETPSPDAEVEQQSHRARSVSGQDRRTDAPVTKLHRSPSGREALVVGTLDSYRLLMKVGSGAHATVYLALSTLSKEELAVKLVQPRGAEDGGSENGSSSTLRDSNGSSSSGTSSLSSSAPLESLDECTVLRRLRAHKHITSLREDFLLENNTRCIVTQYANSGDLLNFLQVRGRVRPDLTRRLFRQVCMAVEYAHAHGIVHRDLKLENILLHAPDHHRLCVLVCDWGYAAEWSNYTLLTQSCGSIHYAAPEILRGHHYVGPPTDVWSLGVVLYAFLVGRFPFFGGSSRDIALRICDGAASLPARPADVPSEAWALVLDCFELEPACRPSVSELLAQPWLADRKQSPAANATPPPSRETVLAQRRERSFGTRRHTVDTVVSLSIEQPGKGGKPRATTQQAPRRSAPRSPSSTPRSSGSPRDHGTRSSLPASPKGGSGSLPGLVNAIPVSPSRRARILARRMTSRRHNASDSFQVASGSSPSPLSLSVERPCAAGEGVNRRRRNLENDLLQFDMEGVSASESSGLSLSSGRERSSTQPRASLFEYLPRRLRSASSKSHSSSAVKTRSSSIDIDDPSASNSRDSYLVKHVSAARRLREAVLSLRSSRSRRRHHSSSRHRTHTNEESGDSPGPSLLSSSTESPPFSPTNAESPLASGQAPCGSANEKDLRDSTSSSSSAQSAPSSSSSKSSHGNDFEG